MILSLCKYYYKDVNVKVEYLVKSNALYVTLIGELDDSSSDYVRSYIDWLIDELTPKTLYINLSLLSFMDSTGIGVLIGRYKRLSVRGVPIIIQSPTKSVDRVLALSGIYEIMKKAV